MVPSHIKPCLQDASDDPARFVGVRVLGVDERRVASPGPTPPGPTRAHRHRGPDARGGVSHGPLEWIWSHEGLAPRMRTGWPSAANSFAPVSRSRRWIPSRDIRTPLMTSSKTQPACSTPFTSSSSPATLQVRYAAASSKTRPVTAHAQATPSTQVRNLLRASHTQAHPTPTRTPP